MGYSISWLAIRAPSEVVFGLLGLAPTGREVEFPEGPIVGAALSSGWTVVVASGCDHPLIGDPALALASASEDVIACSVEEHVMYSRSVLWSRGSRIWSIAHDAQQSIDHLETSGALPAVFSEVRDRLLAQQEEEGSEEAEVDFVFDTPLEIAERITGFRHDAAGEPERFAVLEPLEGSILARARPWWKFW